MTPLARWLEKQLQDRGLSQRDAAARARVSMATISTILRQDHIPKVPTLMRLAEAFDASAIDILQLSGHLTPADQLPGAETAGQDHDDLTWQLIHEYRRVPDEWKEEAVRQIAMFARLAKLPRTPNLGDEHEHTAARAEEEQPRAQEPSEPVPAQLA